MTFEIGDNVVATDFGGYPAYPKGTKGVIVDILPEVCPYRYIVDFGDGHRSPVEELEISK